MHVILTHDNGGQIHGKYRASTVNDVK